MSVVCFNKLLLQDIIYLRGFILGEGFRCTLKSHILIVYLYRVTYPFKVNLHFAIAGMSSNFLLEKGMISEI